MALFGPALALGARFDAQSESTGAHVAIIAGGSIVCAVLLSLAARESARHTLSCRAYTIAWFTLVAGLLWSHMNARCDAVNQRFDDMRDLWRAELKS